MKQDIVIDVDSLTHTYENGFRALKELSFQITRGELTALIGQNGAGKTTLVKHLNGLLRPSSGRVTVAGIGTAKQKISTLAKKVGFVFQNPDHQIFKETVFREVAFGPENMGLPTREIEERVMEALRAVGLAELADSSPQNLSKGQRQRVALASVLAMRTEIIVLDEPTTGQDYRESLQIMDLVRELNSKGHTILFITHDMSLVARYARRAIVLCEGEILLDGPVEYVFRQVPSLNKTFLHPPQIIELAMSLNDHRITDEILTPEDLVRAFTTDIRRIANGSGC